MNKKRIKYDKIIPETNILNKSIIKRSMIYKPPFFKEFFKKYHYELLDLGFKKGWKYGGIETYHNNLDKVAKFILIPNINNI